MSSISTSVEVVDRVSGSLNRITAALYNTTSAFGAVDRASDLAFNPEGISAMTQEMYGYETRIQQLEADLVHANGRLEQMEAQTKQAADAADTLKSAFGMVGSIIAAIGIGEMVKQAIDYASDLQEVQNVVDVTFGSSASVVDEWSKTTLNAFGLNELSAKQFTGTMGAMLKSSGLAGDTVQEMSMKITELSGDMASFYNLDAEDAFNKLRSGISGETEPLKQLGINMSVANLEAYALSQGIQTAYSEMSQAEQVTLRYQYLLQATADAQGDFSNTSHSFSNQVKLLKENWTSFTGELATNALPILAMGIDILNSGITMLSDNWSVISPILTGILTIVGLYVAALAVYNTVKGITTAIEAMHTFVAKKNAAAQMMQSGATFAATAAQYGFNAALLACPLTWILIIIIAVIAAIYGIVAAINKVTGSTISATGIILGVLATLGGHILNTFIVPLYNSIVSFINFFGNAFNDPVSAAKVLFYDMVLSVIGYISNMASAIENVINKIPGVTVDITSGLDSFQKEIEAAQQKVKDESGWVEYATKMDYVDYGDAWNAGYSLGEGFENKMSGAFDSITDTGTGTILDGVDTIASNTSEISEGVSISNENLKYLRDIAEQETVNRFTTAEIKVDMTNNNNISSGMDIDGIITTLSDGLLEAMAVTAEGVY